MSALAVIGASQMSSNLVPLTSNTGGTSESDPNAGADDSSDAPIFAAITTADRAGAAILTIVVVVSIIGLSVWIML